MKKGFQLKIGKKSAIPVRVQVGNPSVPGPKGQWIVSLVCHPLDLGWIGLRGSLGTRLTERIPDGKIYEKYGLIPLSRTIMKERLKWIGYILQMEDD